MACGPAVNEEPMHQRAWLPVTAAIMRHSGTDAVSLLEQLSLWPHQKDALTAATTGPPSAHISFRQPVLYLPYRDYQ